MHLNCLYLARNDILDGTCFEDSKRRIIGEWNGREYQKHDLKQENSKEHCIAACRGYQYAGTEHGYECFCGNQKPDQSLKRPGECNDICPGNANENCGGHWRINIYDTVSIGN